MARRTFGRVEIVAGAETKADFLCDKSRHGAERLSEFGEHRGSGGCDQFVRFLALRKGDAARAKNGECGRRGDRETPMRAVNPAGPLHHRAGQHTGFAEQLQSGAGAHDVDDGIHRSHFVKMHLLRRQAVDLAFRNRDTLKNVHRLLLDPIRERAGVDKLLDLREIAAVGVLMLVSRAVASGMGGSWEWEWECW